jgi:hypothetical protein
MGKVIWHNNSTAAWQELVCDAQSRRQMQLGEDLESYLVFMLMRFTEQAGVHKRPVALDFLETLHTNGELQKTGLREVGDKCLLFSGFFPGLAEKRRVKISYFVDVGQSAYHILAGLSNKVSCELFVKLSNQFVPMMDVLQCMREMSSENTLLKPLDAMELWQDTNSKHALDILKEYTDAKPFKNSGFEDTEH